MQNTVTQPLSCTPVKTHGKGFVVHFSYLCHVPAAHGIHALSGSVTLSLATADSHTVAGCHRPPITTGNPGFAEGLKLSAKGIKHSAKPFLRVALGTGPTGNFSRERFFVEHSTSRLRRPKKVAVNGGIKLTVFEPFFADGLEAGLSAKRGVFIFLNFFCVERPWQGRRQRLFFFEKNLCRKPLAKAVGKDGFLFFKKNSLPRAPWNYARRSWEHPSWADFSQSCRV
jgi:hypothetical protein